LKNLLESTNVKNTLNILGIANDNSIISMTKAVFLATARVRQTYH